MNKYYYIAVTVSESGKFYSYVVKVSQSDKLVSKLCIKNLVSANISPTKKHAEELVTRWNNSYKLNGQYMFDEPIF